MAAPEQTTKEIESARALCERLERRLDDAIDKRQAAYDEMGRARERSIEALLRNEDEIPWTSDLWAEYRNSDSWVSVVAGASRRARRNLADLTGEEPAPLCIDPPEVYPRPGGGR